MDSYKRPEISKAQCKRRDVVRLPQGTFKVVGTSLVPLEEQPMHDAPRQVEPEPAQGNEIV